MKLSPQYLKRYKDIAVLLWKYGDRTMVSRLEAGFDPDEQHTNGTPKPGDLPGDLERMGPTFVKVGQLLSSRADLLPAPYLKELSRLQDKVKPFPWAEVQEIVEAELGTKINKAFSRFDPVPIAAASLGQVHAAALHNGSPVAVKVQRPNIRKQVADDFAAFREIAKFMHRHTWLGERYRLLQVMDEFEETLLRELDYQREAANMVTLRANLAEFSHIRIPKPIPDYTTHKILTMDFIEDYKISELSPLARQDMDGHALAEHFFCAYLKQVLVDGFFHADPHPGNILLTPDHSVAVLDLGMVGHLTPELQEHLLKLLLAVSEGNGGQAADVAIAMSQTVDNFDEMAFRHKIALIAAEQHGAALREMDIGKAILSVGRIAGDTGLYIPTELSLLGKTLLQLDEIGRALDPDFDPTESVRRNASEILNQRFKSSFTEGRLFATLLDAKQFVGALPARVNKILDAVGKAQLNVKVQPAETQFILESFQKVANRITTGLVLAALIIGAALLMRVPTSFEIFGYPGLAILCFIGAAGGGSWLLLNILWQDHKSKHRQRG